MLMPLLLAEWVVDATTPASPCKLITPPICSLQFKVLTSHLFLIRCRAHSKNA